MSYELAALILPSVDDHLESLVFTCQRLRRHYTHDVFKSATRKLLAKVIHLFGQKGEACLVQELMQMDMRPLSSKGLKHDAYEPTIDACYDALLEPVLLNAMHYFAEGRRPLSVRTQRYMALHHKNWLALFPMQFDRRLVEKTHPGLLQHAYIVHELEDTASGRVEQMDRWLHRAYSANKPLMLPDMAGAD